MDKALFSIALAEISEETSDADNPYLAKAKFILTDDKGAPVSTAPKGLLQGIEFEDFDEVARTAINTPIKMRFLGESAGNHLGAQVIGHIIDVNKAVAEDGSNQLIADAILYAEEFPEEVAWLRAAHAEKKAPGISYEIIYGDSIIKDGVQWLKKMITTAATFVRDPAYGKRTALLALASAKEDEDIIPVLKNYIALAEGSSQENPNDEGGKNVDPKELEDAQQEVAKFKAEAETKTAEISRLAEEIETLKAENDDLKETIQKAEAEKRIEDRVRKLSDAGFPLEADAEKATKTKNFIVTLDDDAFATYLENLEAVKKAATPSGGAGAAFASRRTDAGIPRPDDVAPGTDVPTFRFRQ